MSRRHASRKPASLEDRYITDTAHDGTRDDMLQALCRIADQLKRIADHTTNTTKENK